MLGLFIDEFIHCWKTLNTSPATTTGDVREVYSLLWDRLFHFCSGLFLRGA